MQDLVNVVTLGSIYLLFALGMSLTWGTIDILNFGHGSIFMFSTFCAYLVLAQTSLPLLPVVLIGIVAGAVMSLLIQVVAFEQILKRAKDKRTAEMQILIGGIGVAIIPLAIAQHHTKSNPFGLSESSYQVDTWVVGDIRITSIAALTVIVALVLWGGTAVWLRRSRHGSGAACDRGGCRDRGADGDRQTAAGSRDDGRVRSDGRPVRRAVHVLARSHHTGER